MGLRGLMTLIGKYESFDKVNLVLKATELRPIEILIDFSAFIRKINEIIYLKLSDRFDNVYLENSQSEFDVFCSTIKDFHLRLAEKHIRCVWILSGPKGMDEEFKENDILKYKFTSTNDVKTTNTLLESCDKNEQCFASLYIIPIYFALAQESLKEVGAEVISLPKGECDQYIVYLYKKRKSYAILTNNTAFMVYDDCRVIFQQFLSYYYDGELLSLPFINSSDSNNIIVELSDFNVPITTQKHALDLLKNEYDDYKILVTSFTEMFSLQNIDKVIYGAMVECKENLGEEDIKSILFKKLIKNEIDKEIYSIFHGFSYGIVIAEKSNDSSDSLMDVLTSMRQSIYGYIVDPKLDHVKEWRPRSKECFINVSVTHNWIKTNKIHGEHESISTCVDTDSCGFAIFHKIMTCETNLGPNLFQQFDTKMAFVCYFLRYFYIITHDCNLKLSEDEFKAVFCGVMYQYGRYNGHEEFETNLSINEIRRLRICPTSRCMIIIHWLVELFWNVKYLIGGVLNIQPYLPRTYEVLCGSVLISFYEAVNKKDNRIPNINCKIINFTSTCIFQQFQEQYDLIILELM